MSAGVGTCFAAQVAPALEMDVEASLKPNLFLTLTGCASFHPIVAEAIVAHIEGLPAGTPVALYGCGSIAASLVDGHAPFLDRIKARFVQSSGGSERAYQGYPLVEPSELREGAPPRVILLSTRFEQEMTANLAFLPEGSVVTLDQVLEAFGPDALAARISELDGILEGSGGPEPTHPVSVPPSDVLRRARLKAVFQEIVLRCAEHRLPRWCEHPAMQAFPFMGSRIMVRWALREFMLRRIGDHRAFLRLSGELDALGVQRNREDTFVAALIEQFQRELRAIPPVRAGSGRKPFLLAFPVWGRPYIQRFLDLCLPSLLEPGNLPFLCGARDPVLLIHSDREGRTLLEAAPEMAHLRDMGVEVRIQDLDPALMAAIGAEDNFKYWHLGMIQSVHLAWARGLGADYHILLPDYLYAAGYFRRLLAMAERGERAVLQSAFRTHIDRVLAAAAPFRSGDVIAIEPAVLCAIGLNHQHPDARGLMMHQRPDTGLWPDFHALMWEEPARLHVVSPHTSIAYLDAEVMAGIPDRFFFTLDSEMDKILPPGNQPSFPSAADGLVILELSPAGEASGATSYLDQEAYVQRFWRRIESRRHLDFLGGDSVYPVDPAVRNPRSTMNEETIQEEMTRIRAAVAEGHPRLRPGALLHGLLSLGSAEGLPGAEAHIPVLRAEAARLWAEGRGMVGAAVNPDTCRGIVRGLMHFDLIPEAVECQGRCQDASSYASAVQAFLAIREELAEGGGAPGDPGGFVLGYSVWGANYLRFFLDHHLPSLLAEGNLPFLAATRQVDLSVVTDAQGRDMLAAAPVVRRLETLARVQVRVVDELPSRATEVGRATFYQHYGLLDHIHVELARALGANLVLMPPDTVLSRSGYRTLSEALAEGCDCCTVACIEADLEAVRPILDAQRVDGVLDLDHRFLIDLGIRHKTAYWRSLVMDAEKPLNAYPREFFWRVPGGYRCHSLFMHPILLSSRVMRRPFHPNHENVDWALIHRAIQADGRVKVLPDATGLFILHCSPPDVRAGEVSILKGRVSPALLTHLASIHGHAFPIHRQLIAQAQFFPAEDPEFAVSSSYLEEAVTLRSAYLP